MWSKSNRQLVTVVYEICGLAVIGSTATHCLSYTQSKYRNTISFGKSQTCFSKGDPELSHSATA